MKKLQTLRIAAVTVLGLGLGAGVASAAPGDASIDNTGPDSYNSVRSENDVDVDVDNDNDVDVKNRSDQRADSGDATVRHNTTGGDATSGDAMNDNWTRVSAEIDNSGSAAVVAGAVGGGGGSWSGSIDTTGPDSHNTISFENDVDVDINNDNNIDVDNDSDQNAYSGDARVSGNTTGGDATSGDATNINTTEVSIKVTN
ncbi:MAG: hypothetical protein ABIR46_04180 [Candidatus Saccharimonadales bacterium]